MKNIKLIFFVIFLMQLSLNSQTLTKEEMVDTLLQDYAAGNPGASVMVIEDGDILYKNAYGLANINTNEPVITKTNFRLASVTKQFTAAAIMLLIQKGKLSLDTKLTDVFPSFPEYGNNITIKNLLNHTSGLIDYESLIPDTATVQVLDKDCLQMMMEQDSTYFVPGSIHQYSNTGYAVLAMIVEKISGKSFAQFLKDNIFTPLGMDNTLAFQKGINEVNNRAYGNVRTDSGWVQKDQSITSAVLGDGGVYSSVEDLYKWDQSLYTEKILPKEVWEEAFTRNILSTGDTVDYGYGWRLKKFGDDEVVYHTGSTMGGRTIIYRIPSKKFTVIFLTNRDEGDTLGIAEKIVGIYLE